MNQANFKIRNYVIYGEAEETLRPHFVHSELIDANMAKIDGHVKPHIHSHLIQVFLIEEGPIRFTSEQMEVEIMEPCILLIPEDTLHEFHLSQEVKGRIVTFSTSLLEELLALSPEKLLNFETIHLIQNSKQTEKLNALFFIGQQIANELEEQQQVDREIAIRAHLSLLMVGILRLMSKNVPTNHPEQSINATYFSAFQKRLKNKNTFNKPIKQYAKELQITPTHLNRICRMMVDKSASQVVQEYVILEAKRYLSYSTHTISEVGYYLNFADPGYFCRYFKKHVGVSPKVYRKNKQAAIN